MSDDVWTHRITGGPWPERVGLRCREATPPPGQADRYPWHGNPGHLVVVVVEDDPSGEHHGGSWSCVIRRDALAELA